MKRNETSSIVVYRKLTQLRNLLKDIQQLSWNITQFDKKFPLASASEETYPELVKSYVAFGQEVDSIAHYFREETIDDKTIDEITK